MSNGEITPEEVLYSRTAFALFIGGCVAPFLFARWTGSASVMLFMVCEALAFYLGMLGRHTPIGRMAYRSAFVVSIVVLFTGIAMAWCPYYVCL